MLTKRQQQVAQAMFDGAHSECDILTQYKVSKGVFQKWLADPEFKNKLDQLCQSAARETQFIIARYGPVAALRLAELISSEKDDVARRAALDLIERNLPTNTSATTNPKTAEEENPLTDDQARNMLKSLAEGLKNKTT